MYPDFHLKADLPETATARGLLIAEKRSWIPGRKHFERTGAGIELPMEVRFPADSPPLPQARLSLRYVSQSTPSVRVIPLEPHPDKLWTGAVTLPDPGIYELSLHYRLGDQWFVESAPPGWFLADPPWLDSLATYTFIPNINGTIQEWTEDLRRIRDLGFNTIQLLPVTAMDKSESPYAADHLFRLDESYKTPGDPRTGMEQFAAWVEAIHNADLALCLDLVFNHIGLHSELVRRRPQWIEEDLSEADGFRRAGWQDGTTWHKWHDVVRINYSPAAAEDQAELFSCMTDYACFWAQFAAHTRGLIRLDNLHSSNHNFMRQALRAIRDRYPEIVILGELFDTGIHAEDLVLDYGLNLMLATPWEYKFAPELRNCLQGLHHCSRRLRFHTPITSHDSGSPAEEFGDGRTIPSRLCASALLGPGPWGVVQGIEYGLKKRHSFIGRQARLTPPADNPYGELIRRLNQLRMEHPAFCKAGNLIFIDDQHPAVLAALRLDPRSRKPLYLVLVNMDIYHEQQILLDLQGHGIHPVAELPDLLGGPTLEADANRLRIGLEPGGVRAFALPACREEAL